MQRIALLGLLVSVLAGCQRSRGPDAPLRLGYFPNLTHAQALVGDAEGEFASALNGTKLEMKRFNAGPSAMEALLAGELDVAYVGPGPALNAFVRSKGELRVIAGAASGGAVLIARSARSAEELRGKRVASPQLGNTQDIALRYWLKRQGLEPSAGGGGDVIVVPVTNPDILNLFRRGELEGAWVPEPWGARLLAEAEGHILVDERELWRGGRFPTTVLVASSRALKERRGQVLAILRAHLRLTERGRADPQEFAQKANAAFAKIAGKPLPEPILQDAFSRIELTTDPMADQLAEVARHATELGFLPPADLATLVDDSLLEMAKPPPRGVGGAGKQRE